MPFYKALELLLNTSSGTMISRRAWKAGVLIKTQFFHKESNKYISTIEYVSPSYSNIVIQNTYNATPEDMIANDWYIVKE